MTDAAMVHIVRKSSLPGPAEVSEGLVPAAMAAHSVTVREPRPAGFPLMFTAQWQLIEPAVAFLHGACPKFCVRGIA